MSPIPTRVRCLFSPRPGASIFTGDIKRHAPCAVDDLMRAGQICVREVLPFFVAALPDGSRFYVASYDFRNTLAPIPNVGFRCHASFHMLTVFDAFSMTPKTATVVALVLLTFVADSAAVFAYAICRRSLTACAPAPPTPREQRASACLPHPPPTAATSTSASATPAPSPTLIPRPAISTGGNTRHSWWPNLSHRPAERCSCLAHHRIFNQSNVVTFTAVNTSSPAEGQSGYRQCLNGQTLTACDGCRDQFECSSAWRRRATATRHGSPLAAQDPIFL